MNPDRYKTQMNAYAKLIAGTVYLVHDDFGSGQIRNRNFGDKIADEIIQFETQLAKVGTRNFRCRQRFLKQAFTATVCLRVIRIIYRYKVPEK